MVARAITHAAQHPVRELIVGDAGYVLNFMRRLAPALTNSYMGSTGFRQQRSSEAKLAQAPDNLYHHIEGYNQVESDFSYRETRFSPMTWLATHPKARLGLLATLIGGIGFLIGSQIVEARIRRRRGFGYKARLFGSQAMAFLASLPLISSLPMFHRPSLGTRITGALPFRLRRHKNLRDRLPDIPSPRMVSHSVADRGKYAAHQLNDHTSAAAEKFDKRRQKAVEKLSKQSKKTARQISNRTHKAADKIADRLHDLEKARGGRLQVKAEVSGERIRNR